MTDKDIEENKEENKEEIEKEKEHLIRWLDDMEVEFSSRIGRIHQHLNKFEADRASNILEDIQSLKKSVRGGSIDKTVFALKQLVKEYKSITRIFSKFLGL